MTFVETPQYDVEQVLVGVAGFYTAPWGVSVPSTGEPVPPDTLAANAAPGGLWTPVGASDTGLAFSAQPKMVETTIEEQDTPARIDEDTMDVTAEITLAQDSLESMQAAYGIGSITTQALSAGRTDPTCGTTTSSKTVTDTAAATGDVGRTVTGTGIPANATITAVTAGVGFTLSAPATATGASVSLVLGALPKKRTYSMAGGVLIFSLFFEGVGPPDETTGDTQIRRVYIPKATGGQAKVSTKYQRAKSPRMYDASFKAVCPRAQILVYEIDPS